MWSIRICLFANFVGLVLAACGETTSGIGSSNTGDGGTNPSGTGTGNGTSNGTTPPSSGRDANVDDEDSGNSDAGDNDASDDSAARIDGNDGGGCANVFGGYTTLVATGDGCGDINTSAKQCILPSQNGNNPCRIRFNSEQPATVPAVNGGADLQSNDAFASASIKLGTIQRTGCVGSWNEAADKMTVICGGLDDSAQHCQVTMVRSSATCP